MYSVNCNKGRIAFNVVVVAIVVVVGEEKKTLQIGSKHKIFFSVA